jgi:hypothetical protein
MIAGNHDGGELVDYCGGILNRAGVYAAGVYDGTVPPHILKDEHGEVHIYLLPFIKPLHVRRALGLKASDVKTYEDAVRAALAGTDNALQDIREIQAIAQELLESSAAYVDQLRANQSQTDEAYVRMTGNIEQLELVSRQQSNYLKTVSAMQADVVCSVDTMTNAVNSFTRRFAEESANASAAMIKAASDLRASGQHIENIHLEASKALESELSSTLDAYREYVNQFTKRVDYLASGISEALEQMPAAVTDSNDRFLDQMDRLTDTLDQARAGLDEAAARLYRR